MAQTTPLNIVLGLRSGTLDLAGAIIYILNLVECFGPLRVKRRAMSRLNVSVRLLLLATTIAVTSYAQTASTATVVGTVTDAAGAVIPGAKIRIVNVDTQFASETVASTEGGYRVAYLAPGNYRLTVEAAGFKTHVQEGIYVRAAETPRIDVGLEVGSLSENVTVTAAAPLLQTETAASGTTYQGETICAFPCRRSARCGRCTFSRIRSAIASWGSGRASWLMPWTASAPRRRVSERQRDRRHGADGPGSLSGGQGLHDRHAGGNRPRGRRNDVDCLPLGRQ